MPSVHWPGPIVLPRDFDDADAPDALVCPITQCLMTEPALVVSSGRTYERAAIVRWIHQHGVDPLDRGNVLRVDQLAPNLAVRQMVETWARERCGGSLPTQDVRGGSATVATPPPSIAALVDADAAAADRPTQDTNPAPAERTNASLATRPFAGEDEDDPIVDGAVTVLGQYRAPGAPPSEDGKFFLFSSARLAKVLRGRGWAAHGTLADAGGHVKNGAGAALVVTNSRTGETRGCLLWGAGGGSTGVGVGCWNPAEYSDPGSFRRGDVLVLPDFVGADVPAAGAGSGPASRVEKVLAPARVTKTSGTGWNLAGDEIAFGRCGLVGDWWRELSVTFEFDSPGGVAVSRVRTDSRVDLPCVAEARIINDGECSDAWRPVPVTCDAGSSFAGASVVIANVTKVRCVWSETDLHKTNGLSTARGGGGVHCEVIGPADPGATGVTGVTGVTTGGAGVATRRLPMV
uniref:U-box domain-containing protein n=1 Tax=Micromonas pusilla TaxID=38833 RepID=A0A7S0NHT5_MICPS|mmetsp:Transcript_11502/g.48148  ORF Transcript_11502/g.48148 Transcript_11502/m.48148 type:complete len:461 (+) Transcript_11502:209-1591(+)